MGQSDAGRSVVFTLQNLSRFDIHDLLANNIIITESNDALGSIQPGSPVSEFQSLLERPRQLKFRPESPLRKEAESALSWIQSRAGVSSLPVTVSYDGNLTPDEEMEHIRELRQYLSLADDYLQRRTIYNASESTLDVLFVSKIIDPCYQFNSSVYNRNQKFPYLLNFKCGDSVCHTYPKPDVAFFYTHYSENILIIAVESKKSIDLTNSFFQNDKIKLALIGRIMYEVIQTIDSSKVIQIPLMVTSKEVYELYLFLHHENSFHLYKVWKYQCSELSEMARLVFHLRNIPRDDFTSETQLDQQKINRLLHLKRVFGGSLGSSRGSRKKQHGTSSSRGSSQQESSQLQGNTLTNEFHLNDYGILIPNHFFVRHGSRKSDSLPVVIKFSNDSKEIRFLELLNSEPFKRDPRNRTVSPLKIFNSTGPYFDGDDSTFQIVFPIFSVLSFNAKALNPALCEKLGAQLVDHCQFLHEHKICHRDIKPSNLAFDGLENLVVLDCDLMDQFLEDPIVYEFCGTKEFANPSYYKTAT